MANRPTRTVLGGRFHREGAVTYALIGVCVVGFLFFTVFDAFGGLGRWGMFPAAIAFADQWGRLFTSIFLHAGWLHLGFNMYVLFLLGPPLERLLGHMRFLLLFILSGLGGSVASYAFSPMQTLSVGASGAIFGLMAAMIVVGRRLGYDVGQVVALFAINIALGFVLSGIDWRAHLGGALVGAVMGWALSQGGRNSGRASYDRAGSDRASTVNQSLVTLAVIISLALVVAWRTAQLESLVM